MREIKVGIVGCGGIANGKHMPAIKDLGNVKIVAFCDIIKERAEKACKEFGQEDARIYTDYKEMLKKESKRMEAVHILTPNISHSEITVAALESGRHVMCEKPMAKDLAGAKKMLEASKRTGKILTIGYQNRYTAEAQYLKKVCQEGELGEIYYAEAHALRRRGIPTWGVFLDKEGQGGGPLIDIGTHALDLTLWLMDNYEPEMVVGSTYCKIGNKANSSNAFGTWDPETFSVEDSAFGFIKFKNGATVILKSSWAINKIDCKEATCVLCGEKAGADLLDGLKINGEKYGKTYLTTPDFAKGGVAFFDGKKMSPSLLEATTFYNAIINGTELLVKPEQALKVTEILEAIYKSSENGGKPVYFE